MNRSIPTLARLSDNLTQLVEGKLWLQVLIGMVLGLITGILIGPDLQWVKTETGIVIGNWLAFPGRLFLAGIQMIVIPLVFASIVTGLTSNSDAATLKSLGIRAIAIFVLSTAIAAVIGIALALAIEPGQFLTAAVEAAPAAEVALDRTPVIQKIPDLVVGLLPQNPLNAMVEGQMVQIVLFAFVFGVALLTMKRDVARPLIDLLRGLQEVCMSVVRWAMLIAPYAVFGLMAQLTSRTGAATMLGLGVYILTVLLGLVCLLLMYLVVLRIFAKEQPLVFLGKARELLLLAFSTSSSAAVMPLTMKTAIQNFNVRSHIAQFVIPLGATINMNGTAVYQAVAAVFLAQVYQVDLSLASIVLIVLTAVGASIGSPATPGVGIVILSGILSGIGVPPSGVALIIGVDRILDMCRTSVNVSGDLVATILLDRWVDTDQRDSGSTATHQDAPDPKASQT